MLNTTWPDFRGSRTPLDREGLRRQLALARGRVAWLQRAADRALGREEHAVAMAWQEQVAMADEQAWWLSRWLEDLPDEVGATRDG